MMLNKLNALNVQRELSDIRRTIPAKLRIVNGKAVITIDDDHLGGLLGKTAERLLTALDLRRIDHKLNRLDEFDNPSGSTVASYTAIYSLPNAKPIVVVFPIRVENITGLRTVSSIPIVYNKSHPKGKYLSEELLAQHFGKSRLEINKLLSRFNNLTVKQGIIKFKKSQFDSSAKSDIEEFARQAFKDFARIFYKLISMVKLST